MSLYLTQSTRYALLSNRRVMVA